MTPVHSQDPCETKSCSTDPIDTLFPRLDCEEAPGDSAQDHCGGCHSPVLQTMSMFQKVFIRPGTTTG